MLGVLPWLAKGGCYGCIAIENALRAYYDSLGDSLTTCRYPNTMFAAAQRNDSTRWSKAGALAVPLKTVNALFCK